MHDEEFLLCYCLLTAVLLRLQWYYCCITVYSNCKCAEERPCGLTSWHPPVEEGEVCLQLLLCVKATGYAATVSHWTPVLHIFCLTSTVKRSVTVPHLSLSALPQCTISYQPVRKPASHRCLSQVCIVGGGPQSSLNIASGICLDFGQYLESVLD